MDFRVFVMALLAFGAAAQDTDQERYRGEPAVQIAPDAPQGWFGPDRGSVLYDNGPLVNSPGTGAGGADESVVQSASLAMNTLGFGHQVPFGNRIADDFTVADSAGWQIDTITFFAYQTGSSTTSTLTTVDLNIWDGPPAAPGSEIVFSTNATGADLNTSWTGIYRVTETTGGDTNRPIMAIQVALNTFLPHGTFWLDWQTDGTLASGPWAPPITIDGETTTGNGLQSLDDGVSYAAANDSGTLTQQGFPFIVSGSLPCQIDHMYAYHRTVGIIGMCLQPLDLYLNGQLVASGFSVDGETIIALSEPLPRRGCLTLINPQNGVVLAEICFPRNVPALSHWGLLAFVALLAGAGLVWMRRARRRGA